MPLYADESGGLSADMMTVAFVSIEADAARDLVLRFRELTGLRGELKGSRIGLVERALFFELLDRFSGKAWVAWSYTGERRKSGQSDIALYQQLVAQALTLARRALSDACLTVILDDGRYDSFVQAGIRDDVQAMLGSCGTAALADSRRDPGVQIADVVANSVFNLVLKTSRADRIERILAPFVRNGTMVMVQLPSATPANA